MKIDPINLFLDKDFKIDKNIYFISGNESSFISGVKDKLIEQIEKTGSYSKEKIKKISYKKNEGNLFDNNYIYIIDDVSDLDKGVLDNISGLDDKFIFVVENSPKIKLIKSLILKRSDGCIIDCYELNQESKTKVIKYYLNNFEIKLEAGLFWSFVEKLDNKFMLLEKELEKIKELSSDKINSMLLDSIISKKSTAAEEVFFQIFKSNQIVINLYNKNITTNSEVTYLYQLIKRFSLLILSHDNESEFANSVPKYLFREKKFLVDLFKKYNVKKKKSLSDLLYKTEVVLRKNSNLSNLIGLRFLLNFKKISTS